MESVSNSVKRIIDRTPFLYEMLIQGILSYSNYAASIQDVVEKLHGKPVKSAAIVMAVRRYGEELKKKEKEHKSSPLQYEIVMKTNIYDINMVRTDSVLEKLKDLFSLVNPSSGDFLNISVGSHEISLSISEKYLEQVMPLISNEIILHQKGDLVALSLVFSGDFMSTPGIVYEAVRKLAWEEINVNEIISTMNELTFVIRREDSMAAFSVLQSFLGGEF
jgi:aspartokinase